MVDQMNKKIIEFTISFIIGALTIMFGIVLKYGAENFGVTMTIISIAIVIILILGNSIIIGFLVKSDINEKIENEITILKQLTEPRKSPQNCQSKISVSLLF